VGDSVKQPARRGRPGYDQATVLRRAVELFNRQGYDATSMGDLARELGLTKSAIYHHVPSKEHLLADALAEALDSLESALDEVEQDVSLSAYERLRAAVGGSVEVLVAHLPAVTLLLRVHGNSPVEQEALRRRRAIDDRLAAMVRAAADDGDLRADLPPDLSSRLLFGMVNSLVEWVRPGHDRRGDELAAAVTTLAFDGLRVRPGHRQHRQHRRDGAR
jgi:AcrR family transcriptional regulator